MKFHNNYYFLFKNHVSRQQIDKLIKKIYIKFLFIEKSVFKNKIYIDDFSAYLEVIIGGEKDLLMCDDSQHYSYGRYFADEMKAAGLSESDIYKIKIWSSDYPKEFPICGNNIF